MAADNNAINPCEIPIWSGYCVNQILQPDDIKNLFVMEDSEKSQRPYMWGKYKLVYKLNNPKERETSSDFMASIKIVVAVDDENIIKKIALFPVPSSKRDGGGDGFRLHVKLLLDAYPWLPKEFSRSGKYTVIDNIRVYKSNGVVFIEAVDE